MEAVLTFVYDPRDVREHTLFAMLHELVEPFGFSWIENDDGTVEVFVNPDSPRCPHCNRELTQYPSTAEYTFACEYCEEDFYKFEARYTNKEEY